MDKIKLEILNSIEGIKVIDAHEHLDPEIDVIKKEHDLFTLFSDYTSLDLKRAGMSEEESAMIFKTSIPIEQRWKIFKPY